MPNRFSVLSAGAQGAKRPEPPHCVVRFTECGGLQCIKTLYRTESGNSLHKNALSNGAPLNLSSRVELHLQYSAYINAYILYCVYLVKTMMYHASRHRSVEHFHAATSKITFDRAFSCSDDGFPLHRQHAAWQQPMPYPFWCRLRAWCTTTSTVTPASATATTTTAHSRAPQWRSVTEACSSASSGT